ncbi:MAG TPA: hypothetical protein VIY48_14755 [Candidatus Paceibacterota bacterium]
MRDANQLLTDSAVAADAFAANAIEVDKTPVDGLWLQLVITRNGADADETLDITIYGKDTDAAWATTDDPVAITDQVANADVASGATIVKYVRVSTKHKYIKPYYNVGGTTPSYTIVCAVVTGVARETGA